MTRHFALLLGCCVLAQSALAAPSFKLSEAQQAEMFAMITNINLPSLAWRAAVMQRMIAEANFFADRLDLPGQHPIQMKDLIYDYIPRPWFCVIHEATPPYWPTSNFGSNIYNPKISRHLRLRALEIGVKGQIDTSNFFFGFRDGRLAEVMRISALFEERYSRDLDDLVGKPSLITQAQAYELATQWLVSVDIDVPALNKKFPHSVNQLKYLPKGATNAVLLPLYYVDFGLKSAHRDSPVEVEILGTTKELQDMTINDPSFSHRPLLLITNALELARIPNPSVKRLQHPKVMHTNSPPSVDLAPSGRHHSESINAR